MSKVNFRDHTEAKEYIQRFIATVIGHYLPLDIMDRSFVETCFHELSRQEEIEVKWRDQWGNWDWPFGESHRQGRLYIPYLDSTITELRNKLKREHNIPPLWPDDKSFALCLTHDIDDVNPSRTLRNGFRRAKMLRKSGAGWPTVIRSRVKSLLDIIFENSSPHSDSNRTIEDWLAVEDQYGFKSTFFVASGRPVKPNQWDCTYRLSDKIIFNKNTLRLEEALHEIDRLGWEIGLHGSYHSATEPGLLKIEKVALEGSLKKEISSVRQHYLHYETGKTPGLQAAAGLNSDSTVGFNRSIGFRSGTSFPHLCWDHQSQKSLPVLEIPMTIMDVSLFSPGGLEYNPELALHHCLQMMEAVKKQGGCLTLNWHHDYINHDLYWNIYVTILGEASRRGAWGCSAEMLHTWWSEREKTICGNSK